MKLLQPLLFLLLAAPRMDAQGICDSTISIAPIQPVCAGTGEAYLQVSHPGGVYSGPGLIYNTAYLYAEGLSAGFYTVTYTITGPGGCTTQATRQYEVLDAVEASAWASGKIDCSDPNSTITLQASILNGSNFGEGEWYAETPNIALQGNVVTTSHAGKYQYYAYNLNLNGCPAYATVEVGFKNNPLAIQLVSCTNCGSINPGLQIRIDTIPNGWDHQITRGNTGYFSGNNCIPVTQTGEWIGKVINPANGCVSKDAITFASTVARPSVSAGSDLSIPCGESRNFLAATNPANDTRFNFFWATPNGGTAPASSGSLLAATEPGLYVLHGIDTFTGCQDSDTAVATAGPLPVSTQISVICAGDSLLGHTQSGTYFDTIFQANGCLKTQITKLFVLSPLLDEITVEPDNGQMTGSINYVVTQGWPPFIYQWSSGETTASISNLSAGSYTLTVTDANQCTQVRDILVPAGKLPRKAGSDRKSPALLRTKLYPNPAASGLVEYTLEFRASQAGEAILMLNDVLGRCLSTRSIQLLEGENRLTFAETLQEGMYVLFLKGDLGIKEISKLVVTAD